MWVKSKKLKLVVFFLTGSGLGLLFLLISFLALFEWKYRNKVYPGVKAAGLSFGEKTVKEAADFLETKNSQFNNLRFTFVYSSQGEDKIATISGEKLKIGYHSRLLADQAFLIGRSGNTLTALYQKWQAFGGEINLSPAYKFDSYIFDNFLEKMGQEIDVPAQEALFSFEGGRVTAFRPSATGLTLNRPKAKADFAKFVSPPTSGKIVLSTLPVEPKIKTSQANNLGIKELLSEGKSFFRGSIPNRVHNISLAASRLNGILIAPGEVFSFNQALGEISAETGYKQAYIIKEKKTVLDDGGGVCQVSTTLFRAALNAGLAIEERQAHAYRVSYYEQGGFGPGLDATVFSPRVDLKIKNDTPAYILIQTKIDRKNASLTFDLYGTNDGRKAIIGKPKITDEAPPPPDLYQDDPTLAKGQIKQVDFAAWGGKVAFDYKVVKNGEVWQNRTFYSNFQPWQAVYLRGTKEN